eukprot:PLAT5674.1.p1 GENE.PLAT5674.1~~PLAT5674.1.p1  ORF type:complete len:402 (+),score=49.81 PLAT5674.1:32-1207(+)
MAESPGSGSAVSQAFSPSKRLKWKNYTQATATTPRASAVAEAVLKSLKVAKPRSELKRLRAECTAAAAAAGGEEKEDCRGEDACWKPCQPRSKADLARLLAAVLSAGRLPQPPRPQLPKLKRLGSMKAKLAAIAAYVTSFGYNHTGTQFYPTRKDAGIRRVSFVAREVQRRALPIRCLEGAFIAVYLTLGWHDLLRIPLLFRSRAGGHRYGHIVLAVRYKSRWGALGISRKSTLMTKPLQYDTLGALVEDYFASYDALGHRLMFFHVGLPFSHDAFSVEPIQWKALTIHVRPKRKADGSDEASLPLDDIDGALLVRMRAVLQHYPTRAMELLERYEMSGEPVQFMLDTYPLGKLRDSRRLPMSPMRVPKRPRRRKRKAGGSRCAPARPTSG